MFSKRLKMFEGRLFSESWWSGTISPVELESITYVREYGFNNPFLLVISDGERYTMRPWAKDFDAIVDLIEQHTDFEIRNGWVHKINRFFYSPWIGRVFARMIRKVIHRG